MEILKRGAWPPNSEHTATCDMCQTQIKFYRNEATVTEEFIEAVIGCREKRIRLTIKCPVCPGNIHAFLTN